MTNMATRWIAGAAWLGMTVGAALGEEAAAPAGHTNRLSGSVFVYCAAGVKEPLSEIAKGFEADTGVKVELTFANTGQLLGQIEMTHKGDVYVPGDIGFARKAQEKNLVSGQPREFCYFVPAILVRKGNPKEVKDVQDLTKPGMKLALADPSAAIGKLQADVFKKNGLDEAALKTNTSVSPATVTDVALAVKMGTVDAGIVWDAIGRMYSADADMVAIPAEKNVIGTVSACVLASTKNPEAAQAFRDFLVSDKGRAVLKARGFALESPQAAKLSGSLFVYCAAGVKDPVTEIAKKFETETNVKMELTFANSGQLLGQIETTRIGDVYIPGDVGFVAKAQEKKLTAGESREFCYFVPVLYVRKGNPKGIHDITDLAKPGIKLALADKSSAVGQIQAQIFHKNNTDMKALEKNTVSSPAMVTDVALAVKMGTVDAGIVWDALSHFAPDEAEAVAIPLEKNVISTVAATVLAGSKNPAAANAFLVYLTSDKGKAILKAKGYTVEKP